MAERGIDEKSVEKLSRRLSAKRAAKINRRDVAQIVQPDIFIAIICNLC
jgi:nucleoside 2-deoxyribosyltransferase